MCRVYVWKWDGDVKTFVHLISFSPLPLLHTFMWRQRATIRPLPRHYENNYLNWGSNTHHLSGYNLFSKLDVNTLTIDFGLGLFMDESRHLSRSILSLNAFVCMNLLETRSCIQVVGICVWYIPVCVCVWAIWAWVCVN